MYTKLIVLCLYLTNRIIQTKHNTNIYHYKLHSEKKYIRGKQRCGCKTQANVILVTLF